MSETHHVPIIQFPVPIPPVFFFFNPTPSIIISCHSALDMYSP